MEREYKFNNSTVTIKFGNILESKADVIVSSDDTDISMGGGISGAIYHAVGKEIFIDTRKFVPATLGDVVVTSAGSLKQKYIFHAITLSRISNRETESHQEYDDVQSYIVGNSIKRCFNLLKSLNLSSIAFPCIGAGAARIPYQKVAKCMAENLSRLLLNTNKSIKVEIYLYDRFQTMTEFDFLPFFEWFASYSSLSNTEIAWNNHNEKAISLDEIEIMDCAKLDSHNEHLIFISYSRRDSETVRGICNILNSINVPYWIDINGIYSGENYKEVIVNAIKSSDIVLFISSKNSNKSQNVAKELSIADKNNKIIIPIKIDSAPFNPQMEYDLSGIDTIEYIELDNESITKIKNAILGQLAISDSRKNGLTNKSESSLNE